MFGMYESLVANGIKGAHSAQELRVIARTLSECGYEVFDDLAHAVITSSQLLALDGRQRGLVHSIVARSTDKFSVAASGRHLLYNSCINFCDIRVAGDDKERAFVCATRIHF